MSGGSSGGEDAGRRPAEPTEPTRRLFFALWPDEAMQQELAHAARKIVRASGGRPVPARNLHVTLAFLGSVAESRLPVVRAVAARVAAGIAPSAGSVSLTLDRVQHWARPRILCATTEVEPVAAAALAQALKLQLAGAGLTPDLRPFRAHVTLARKVNRYSRELSLPPVTWTFGSFSLVDSRTDPEGSLYSVLDSWPLDGSRQNP